jgi:Fe2+ transport system protein FeoA
VAPKHLPEVSPRPRSLAIPLAQLAPGAHAVIESVDATTAIGRRLADLGFLPRTPICVVRRAPLGDPVAYELRGYRLCLRRAEALRVWVIPTDPPPRSS